MEFGKIDTAQLDQVDFTLPADPAINATVLTGKPAGGKIYLGMTQWGRSEYVGKIYPRTTKPKDFLEHYVLNFNAVELNATHYTVYGAEGIAKWANLARGIDFKFCPKMYNGITHKQNALAGKDFLLGEFLRGVEAFGEHLGPIFIQVSDLFNRKDSLHQFLESLPKGYTFFLELRHPLLVSNEELYQYLSTKNAGSVITDTAGRRDCVHMHLTVPKTMIRFVANDHPTDTIRLTEWANRCKVWLDKGIQEIYFFIHYEDESKALDIAKLAVDTINEVCGDIIPKLEFISK